MHRLEAFSLHDFDNQMATFHRFCAKLDLNMDHYPESAWKPDPKAQRSTKGNEMNCIPNLTAFSWKTMEPTPPDLIMSLFAVHRFTCSPSRPWRRDSSWSR